MNIDKAILRNGRYIKPIGDCAACLYKTGLGYDRIAKKLRSKKKNVVQWIIWRIPKPQRRQGSIKATAEQIEARKEKDRIQSKIRSAKRRTLFPKISRNPRIKQSYTQILARKRFRQYLWSFFKKGLYPKIGPSLFGCSRQDLQAWLASQFKPGMSLKNYGSWEIDHIIPCVKFDLKDPEQVKQCFHWSNLRPEWGKANRKKFTRIIPHQQILKLNL